MTTAICNCPEEIGWLPESSWPYTEASKASAQRIYCIDGDPVIPPRGGFKSDWDDTRIQWTPVAGAGNFDTWGAIGNARTLTGAIVTDQTICNPFAYPMQSMAFVYMRWRVSLTGTATLGLTQKILVDAAEYATTTHIELGSDDVAIRQFERTFAYKLPELAVGACLTLGSDVSWTNSDPSSAFSGMGSFVSTIRIWGGSV